MIMKKRLGVLIAILAFLTFIFTSSFAYASGWVEYFTEDTYINNETYKLEYQIKYTGENAKELSDKIKNNKKANPAIIQAIKKHGTDCIIYNHYMDFKNKTSEARVMTLYSKNNLPFLEVNYYENYYRICEAPDLCVRLEPKIPLRMTILNFDNNNFLKETILKLVEDFTPYNSK